MNFGGQGRIRPHEGLLTFADLQDPVYPIALPPPIRSFIHSWAGMVSVLLVQLGCPESRPAISSTVLTALECQVLVVTAHFARKAAGIQATRAPSWCHQSSS